MKVVERLAAAHGLDLIQTVEIDEHTYLPVAFILNEAERARAKVIIAPGLDHLGPGREVVPRTTSVLLPTGFAAP
ncbi:hypothetical protein ACTD5D_40520 [Nocardia takedensis]|uniref:hypothetical protein n=1 Tax=Nocardia takedensis TaxID=259390 RepID=UPI003F768516